METLQTSANDEATPVGFDSVPVEILVKILRCFEFDSKCSARLMTTNKEFFGHLAPYVYRQIPISISDNPFIDLLIPIDGYDQHFQQDMTDLKEGKQAETLKAYLLSKCTRRLVIDVKQAPIVQSVYVDPILPHLTSLKAVELRSGHRRTRRHRARRLSIILGEHESRGGRIGLEAFENGNVSRLFERLPPYTLVIPLIDRIWGYDLTSFLSSSALAKLEKLVVIMNTQWLLEFDGDLFTIYYIISFISSTKCPIDFVIKTTKDWSRSSGRLPDVDFGPLRARTIGMAHWLKVLARKLVDEMEGSDRQIRMVGLERLGGPQFALPSDATHQDILEGASRILERRDPFMETASASDEESSGPDMGNTPDVAGPAGEESSAMPVDVEEGISNLKAVSMNDWLKSIDQDLIDEQMKLDLLRDFP